jgi:NAD(P)-dependent dehydrogenase (short-subunit alcohol dehydrogenase family)
VTSRSVTRYLQPTAKLSNHRIMVIGGTRGLGRGITLALAQQGAEVLVVHRAHSQDCLIEMRKDLGQAGSRLVSLCSDASETKELAATLRDVPTLDGLVLPPTPSIPSLPLSLSAMTPALNFVQQSLELAWTPLAVCVERLRDGASIVMLSSEAVEKPPALWSHYVAAKMALEGIAQYCASQGRWRVTIARPPRLWTELTNAATGHIGTVPTEYVAARIVEVIVADVCGLHQRPHPREASVLSAERLSPDGAM